ncbi:MAG: acyl-CoA dehydrogenase family protein, partial [Desulfobulbaceae bacterium]|nr:acyl-CoA dehydrogenase family protein [Desulfobulbaceae bacterium]
MDYFLTEEQQMIVDTAREIANEKIIPKRAELDEKNEFPKSILEDMARADLFGIFIPEEYGGFGGGCFEIVLALEEMARGCVGVATSYAASALGIFPVLIAGSDEMKQKYLPDVAAGKKWAAFGLTEANAGSDASGVRTTAVLDGNEWVLNGTKQWIT